MNKDCAKGKNIPLSLTVTVDLRICLVDADAQGEKKLIEEETDTLERREKGKRKRKRKRERENREFLPFLPLEGEEDTLDFKCHSGLTKAVSRKVFPNEWAKVTLPVFLECLISNDSRDCFGIYYFGIFVINIENVDCILLIRRKLYVKVRQNCNEKHI